MPRRKPSSSSSVSSSSRMPRRSRRSAATPGEQRRPSVGERDADHAPVLVVAAALDEAALLHAVHDPGGARLRDVERLRQGAHRERAVRLEDGQDVEVDEAQRPRRPAPHVADMSAGVWEVSSSSSSLSRRSRLGCRAPRGADPDSRRSCGAWPWRLRRGGLGMSISACPRCPSWHIDGQCDVKGNASGVRRPSGRRWAGALPGDRLPEPPAGEAQQHDREPGEHRRGSCATDSIPPPSRSAPGGPVSAQDWGISRAIDCIVAGMIWSGIMQPPSAPSARPRNTPSDPAWSGVRAQRPDQHRRARPRPARTRR